MRGVIYARYSPGPHQTEQSIEGQVADCQQYAEEHGIDIIEIYADRHVSGKSVVGRDEFQRMLRDAEKGRFDCVLVWKIDRFGRDRQDIAMGKVALKRAGVKLMYARESVPEGPEGIILESVLEGLAEYYSADRRQKVIRGMKETAKKGQYCGQSLPIGYKVDAERHIVVDEREAAVVREAFKLHIAGGQIRDIVQLFAFPPVRPAPLPGAPSLRFRKVGFTSHAKRSGATTAIWWLSGRHASSIRFRSLLERPHGRG